MDETLEISGGPVTLNSMLALVREGHIIGLCGNWAAMVQRVQGWNRFISFFNAAADKAPFLANIRQYVPAEDYVMVGNILGVSGASDDSGAAAAAGWRFIREADFAAGAR